MKQVKSIFVFFALVALCLMTAIIVAAIVLLLTENVNATISTLFFGSLLLMLAVGALD